MNIINGYTSNDIHCDSDFTFYRGNLRSQIDLAFSNNISTLKSFKIGKKYFISDHVPVTFSVDVTIRPSLSMIRESSRYAFNDDHLDINKRLRTPINTKRLDPIKLVAELEEYAANVNNMDLNDIGTVADQLSAGIYDACKNSLTNNKQALPTPNPNCTSKNIRAICEAHFTLYTHKIDCNAPVDEINLAARSWWEYNCLALDMERKEYNTNINKKWVHCNKNDTRQMWKMIDWKGQSQLQSSSDLDPTTVHCYFRNIFQSEKTCGQPIVKDIQQEITTYAHYHPELNAPISMTELKPVLLNVGKGIGFDGIPPAICKLFPQSLCTHLLNILDQVFNGSYPSSWMKQLLFPIEKKGHTLSTPKLRGIALSSVLPRIYDTIIDNRFSNWYTPNKEQSGFREGQGCTLQQLFLSLMLELAKESHADLYILLIDYEKAFDYANRAIILKYMTEEGAGDTFLRAIASMY